MIPDEVVRRETLKGRLATPRAVQAATASGCGFEKAKKGSRALQPISSGIELAEQLAVRQQRARQAGGVEVAGDVAAEQPDMVFLAVVQLREIGRRRAVDLERVLELRRVGRLRDQHAAWREAARELGQRAFGVVHVLEQVVGDDEVEVAVRERHRLGVDLADAVARREQVAAHVLGRLAGEQARLDRVRSGAEVQDAAAGELLRRGRRRSCTATGGGRGRCSRNAGSRRWTGRIRRSPSGS